MKSRWFLVPIIVILGAIGITWMYHSVPSNAPTQEVHLYIAQDVLKMNNDNQMEDMYGEIQMVHSIIEHLNSKDCTYKLVVKQIGFESVINNVANSKTIAIGAGGFAFRELADKRLEFSIAYYPVVREVLVSSIPMSSTSYPNKIGIQSSTTQHESLNEKIARNELVKLLQGTISHSIMIRESNVKAYDSIPNLINKLSSNEVNAIIVDEVIANMIDSNQTGLKIKQRLYLYIITNMKPHKFGFLLNKENKKFNDEFNKILEKVRPSSKS